MMMMVGVIRVPGGFPLPPSNQPLGFTPDATTAITNPGVYYRPFNAPDGSPLGLYKTGPRNDGFILGNGQQFFDGNVLWNRRMGSEDVSAAINNMDYLFLQGDQYTRWQQGLYPYPPAMDVPQNYPAMPGTPLNPFGALPNYAVQNGMAAMPQQQQAMQQQRVPQQQQQVPQQQAVPNAQPNTGVQFNRQPQQVPQQQGPANSGWR
ncbi:MAG: hypothetical protein NTW61_04035 [Candidatus Melainabacteria bacterium]|jgi:hypothetical protein|nr:hypothetical protein [Candidatus Melainabacteria bacterium]